jgi:hypothetical protein
MYNWNKYLQSIENNSNKYLKRLKISTKSNKTFSFPDIYKITSEMINNYIQNNSSKPLVIIFPSKLDSAKWLFFTAVLKQILIDYNYHKNMINTLSKGQKILINKKAIATFDEINSKGEIFVKARSASGLGVRVVLEADLVYSFKPYNGLEENSTERVIVKQSNKAETNLLDDLLNISTYGGTKFFENSIVLVDRINQTDKFLKDFNYRGETYINLVLWAKVTKNKMKYLSSKIIDSTAPGIISANLYNICGTDFINSKVKAYFINGLKYIFHEPDSFDRLSELPAKKIIISDLNELEYFSSLRKLDCLVWVWDSKSIGELNKHDKIMQDNIFNPQIKSIRNYNNQTVKILNSENKRLEFIIEKIQKLSNLIEKDNPLVEQIGELYYCALKISRIIRKISYAEVVAFKEEMSKGVEKICSQSMWLSEKELSEVAGLKKDVDKCRYESLSCVGTKYDTLIRALKDTLEHDKILIILNNPEEISKTESFIKENVSISNIIDIKTHKDIFKISTYHSYTRILICGWLNNNRTFRILNSNLGSCYEFIFYSFESKYYKRTKAYYDKLINVKHNREEIASMLGIPVLRRDIIEEEEKSVIEEESFDIIKFENLLNRTKISKYISNNDSNEVRKAKAVYFSSDYFSFLTNNHQNYIITTLLFDTDSEQEIEKLTLEKIKIGDYLLYRSTGKDIISEIVEYEMVKDNKTELLRKASYWQKLLQTENIEKSDEEIIKILKTNGCRRHPETIRNWIFDDKMIAPQDNKDLELILNCFDVENKYSYNELLEPISLIRSAHLIAASYLSKKILNILPNELKNINIDNDEDIEINLDLEHLGNVKILRVNDISYEWENILMSDVNKLIKDDTKWQ